MGSKYEKLVTIYFDVIIFFPQDINNEYLHSKSYSGHPMLNPHSCGPIHSSYDLQLSKNDKYQVVFILAYYFVIFHFMTYLCLKKA